MNLSEAVTRIDLSAATGPNVNSQGRQPPDNGDNMKPAPTERQRCTAAPLGPATNDTTNQGSRPWLLTAARWAWGEGVRVIDPSEEFARHITRAPF